MTEAFVFLSTIFHGVPGCTSVWERISGGSPTHHVDDRLGEEVRAIGASKETQQVDARGHDAYFGVCTRVVGLTRWQQGVEEELVAMPALWLDVDVGAVGHKSKTLAPDVDAALAVLKGALPPWTAAVTTGGGVHLYWKLETALLLGTANDRARAKNMLRELYGRALKAFQPNGWHLDDVGTLPRVMRVPGTGNWKTGERRDVRLIDLSGERCTLETFSSRAGASLITTGITSLSRSPRGAPARDEKEAVPKNAIWDRLELVRTPSSALVVSKLKKGESLGTPGARDVELTRACGVVGMMLPHNDPDEVARVVFGNSLATWAAEEGATKSLDEELEKATAKLERVQAQKRRELADAADLVTSLRQDLRRRAGAKALGDDAATATSGKYSAEELANFAAQAGTTVDGFKKLWVVHRGGAYYVYVGGSYMSPVGEKDLDNILARDLSPAPIEWYAWEGDKKKRRGWRELTIDYGTATRNVQSELYLQKSWYDQRADVLHEAVCPVRDLESRFDAEVDRWLRALGGEHAEKLLDWIATVTRLDKQSCALYIAGKMNAGKSLLARGLAQLWNEGGTPTELGRVLDDFNADLAKCPLVVADEKIDQKSHKRVTTGDLRRLVGTSSRTLTRKFLPNSDLIGAIRVLLLANNDRMLQTDREDLDKEDLAAVVSRFLYIPTGPEVERVMADVTSRKLPERWIAEQTIARHALWLRDNRVVVEGRRFLVEGVSDRMHKKLAQQSGPAALVLEWLAGYLTDPVPQPAQLDLIEAGGGKLVVTTRVFIAFWDKYVKSEKVPSTTAIGRVLGNWSKNSDARVGKRDGSSGHRAHEIPIDVVVQFIEDNHVGDAELVRSRVDGEPGNLRDAGVVSLRAASGDRGPF